MQLQVCTDVIGLLVNKSALWELSGHNKPVVTSEPLKQILYGRALCQEFIPQRGVVKKGSRIMTEANPQSREEHLVGSSECTTVE